MCLSKCLQQLADFLLGGSQLRFHVAGMAVGCSALRYFWCSVTEQAFFFPHTKDCSDYALGLVLGKGVAHVAHQFGTLDKRGRAGVCRGTDVQTVDVLVL